MSIQNDIGAALKAAGIQAYQQAAPQQAVAPFTVYRQMDSEPLMVLGGYSGMTRFDYVFWNIGPSEAAAGAQRDLVLEAIRESDTLNADGQFQISSGQAEYESETNQPIEPCAFSFWHE